jgi:hypothetical protein
VRLFSGVPREGTCACGSADVLLHMSTTPPHRSLDAGEPRSSRRAAAVPPDHG